MNVKIEAAVLLNFLFFVQFVLHPAGSYAQSNQNNKDSLMPWGKSYLTFSDFKTLPDSTKTGVIAAYTLHRLQYMQRARVINKVDYIEVKVLNNFLRHKSWIKQAFIGDTLLLKHEQNHFDIGEIYARRFMKKVASFYFTSDFKQAFVSMMNENGLLLEQEHKRYDTETDLGRNRPTQKIWSQNIEAELKALEPFASKTGLYKINRR